MTAKKFPPDPSALNDTVKESAQQIWLAGLGAFAKAQQEGGKVFETLVNDGLAMQRKAQTTAEEKIAEATQKMSTMAQELSAQASQFGSKASGSWDKLESIFEDRVARALVRLGLPTAAELEALQKRVASLEAAAAASKARTPRAAAKKTAGAAKKLVKKK
jgi:poly(hydroxyalkanoate) granule-associated protein